MENTIEEFLNYLREVKKTSANTEASYRRDLTKLVKYLSMQGVDDITKATTVNIQSYVLYLEKNDFAAATVSRNIASIKSLFHYLFKEGRILFFSIDIHPVLNNLARTKFAYHTTIVPHPLYVKP